MRLTSAMWFAVFMRLEQQRGAFVAVRRKGAQEAGAIFVVQVHDDDTQTLFAPAPQTMFDAIPGRIFEKRLDSVDRQSVDEYLEKQVNFDSDLWIIETESGSGEPGLDIG